MVDVHNVNREGGAMHNYVKKVAVEEISRSYELNDGSITRLHFLKIQWYMATTLYLGKLLVRLRPSRLTKKEKQTLIYLGAIMAIADLMVDDFKENPVQLTRLNTDERERKRTDLSPITQALLLYYRKFITVTGKKEAAFIHDLSLLKPQIDSRKQMSGRLSKETVMEHTRQKGGSTLLLVASLLFPVTPANRDVFYQLGAFIQLMNDSQDLPGDVKNGITTFVSFMESYSDIRQFLKGEFNKTATLFLHSDYPRKEVYRLLFNLHALFTGINYKLYCYEKVTGVTIDTNQILHLDNAKFRVNLFSWESISYCLPRIIRSRTN